MKRTYDQLWFYGLAVIGNVVVGVMLLVVNIPLLRPSMMVAQAVPLTVTRSVVQPVAARQGLPIHITIPSLGIDLAVGEGSYDASDGTWNVDDTKAYYADMSVPINDHNGTTLIYGHAQSPVFASLPNIQAGSEAMVTTDTGFIFHYKYASMREVVPSDTSIFTASGPPTLTLQTCMGDWDMYRGLFSFTLESVEKI